MFSRKLQTVDECWFILAVDIDITTLMPYFKSRCHDIASPPPPRGGGGHSRIMAV